MEVSAAHILCAYHRRTSNAHIISAYHMRSLNDVKWPTNHRYMIRQITGQSSFDEPIMASAGTRGSHPRNINDVIET